ncbi:MAG: hypothetical protein mread185_000654 [Mycoplasmataceae bacterium]|nr:MAG: hypothetical protein mread185_000654 [Mycoplasmataceae bacterium]
MNKLKKTKLVQLILKDKQKIKKKLNKDESLS